ncbi:transposase [Streptococcus pneumoniae]|nr:transposase [Streptococcus pneumoniae]
MENGHYEIDTVLLTRAKNYCLLVLTDVFSEEHIYYAHPYASWERGTNENHNRFIRRWLPKGTKKMTPKEVAFIEKWINNYPKKCLDYKSPREDFWMANLNLKFSKMEIIFIKRFQ